MKKMRLLIPVLFCCILIQACKSPEERGAEAGGYEYSDSVKNSPPPAGPDGSLNMRTDTGNARSDSNTINEMIDSSKHP